MMMGFGLIGLLLLVGVVIALVVGGTGLLRQFSGPRIFGQGSGRTPRQMLDERLARGEISREEYEAIRATLER